MADVAHFVGHLVLRDSGHSLGFRPGRRSVSVYVCLCGRATWKKAELLRHKHGVCPALSQSNTVRGVLSVCGRWHRFDVEPSDRRLGVTWWKSHNRRAVS
ncbi:hypothetical protein AOLI_G00212960 [Acnodon oligacanthus]